MSENTKNKVVVTRSSDVGEFGDKPDRGNADYARPLMVAGEQVDLDSLPALTASDKQSKRAPVRA